MKILTLNTWTEKGPWRERWEIIFEGIRGLRPDVICLQEVFNAEWAKEIKRRTRFASLVYLPESKESGLAILSNFTLLTSAGLKFQKQSLNFEPRRHLLYAHFKAGESCFFVFNTHLTWRLTEAEIRAAQVDEILKSIPVGGGPIVLCGDFNASAQTAEVRLVTAAGFTDTYEACNPGANTLTWDNKNPYAASASSALPDRRIDFIFTRGFEGPKSSRVVLEKPNENGVYASDHYGVLTEF